MELTVLKLRSGGFMRVIVLVIGVLLIASQGCGGASIDNKPGNCLLRLQGFDEEIGRVLSGDFGGGTGGLTNRGEFSQTVLTGDFSLTLSGFVEAGSAYRVRLWTDVNGNGSYDLPPVDHSWIIEGMARSENVDITFMHMSSWDPLEI